jgi:hypothetical protein
MQSLRLQALTWRSSEAPQKEVSSADFLSCAPTSAASSPTDATLNDSLHDLFIMGG